MEESLKFYTNVLGMIIVEPLQKTAPTKGSVVTLKSTNSEQVLELNYYEEDSPFNSSYVNGEDLDHIAFDVQDLEGAVKELKRRGVEVVVEPYVIGVHQGSEWNLDRTLTTKVGTRLNADSMCLNSRLGLVGREGMS